MTTSRDANPYADIIPPGDHMGLAIAADLEVAYSAAIPVHTLDPSAPRTPQPRPFLRHSRALALGAAAVALLSAVLLVPAIWDRETETVSAQEILTNARAAAENPAGYHRVYRSTYLGDPNPNVPNQIQVGEIWYRDPAHHRVEIRDGSGQLLSGRVVNGDEAWLYFWDGMLRVIHFGPNSAIVRDSRQGLNPPGSLGEILAELGGCDTPPAITGEATVIGRPVHVVENCGHRLWVDQESFFVLGSGPISKPEASQDPNVVDLNHFRTETLAFDWAVEFSDDTFVYEPPPGTFVVEQDF